MPFPRFFIARFMHLFCVSDLYKRICRKRKVGGRVISTGKLECFRQTSSKLWKQKKLTSTVMSFLNVFLWRL